MTEQAKKRIMDLGTAYIGIPIVVLMTVAIMSGRKLENIDILNKRVDILEVKVDVNSALLSIINTKLSNIIEDVGEVKSDIKELVKISRYNNINGYSMPQQVKYEDEI